MRLLIILGVVVLCAGVSYASPPTWDVLPPSLYDPSETIMNGNLGISFPPDEVEGFEGALNPGLLVNVEGHTSYTVISGATVDNLKWDGNSALQNLDEQGADGRDVEFEIIGGATRLGVGISHLEQYTAVFVSLVGGDSTDLGVDIRSDSDWYSGGPHTRNGYLWIEAPAGEAISTVRFDALGSDSIFFDHVAWTPVPEPTSLLLLLSGGLLVVSRRRSSTR